MSRTTIVVPQRATGHYPTSFHPHRNGTQDDPQARSKLPDPAVFQQMCDGDLGAAYQMWVSHSDVFEAWVEHIWHEWIANKGRPSALNLLSLKHALLQDFVQKATRRRSKPETRESFWDWAESTIFREASWLLDRERRVTQALRMLRGGEPLGRAEQIQRLSLPQVQENLVRKVFFDDKTVSAAANDLGLERHLAYALLRKAIRKLAEHPRGLV